MAVGDLFVYVGPDDDEARAQGVTYQVRAQRGATVWMIQLPVSDANVDWKGPAAQLEDPDLWQPVP
jgi:hypothetical protein